MCSRHCCKYRREHKPFLPSWSVHEGEQAQEGECALAAGAGQVWRQLRPDFISLDGSGALAGGGIGPEVRTRCGSECGEPGVVPAEAPAGVRTPGVCWAPCMSSSSQCQMPLAVLHFPCAVVSICWCGVASRGNVG